MLTQFEIVDVGGMPRFSDEDEFVLGSVERAHPSIGLVPDANILELLIDSASRDQHLEGVKPIHADVMNRAILRMRA